MEEKIKYNKNGKPRKQKVVIKQKFMTKRITFSCTPSIYDSINNLAEQLKKHPAALVRTIIEDYLKEQNEKM
ncbi:MAG: hypothetical protein EKK57_11095 [Proteobacteria bacterium]|nr:MAG: hypothetical protein EKK57_11095 [Pseudomonadota bacterium]